MGFYVPPTLHVSLAPLESELPLSFPTQLLGRNFLPGRNLGRSLGRIGRNLGRNFGEELGRNLNFAIILVWLFNAGVYILPNF